MKINGTALLILCLSLPAACNRAPLTGPPTLRLGSDECSACGMLVSEDRCSSALLVENEGRREFLYYDDLGCMLDEEREGMPGTTVIERFAHDYETRAWIDASNARYLLCDPKTLLTPMGSGIVAFSSLAGAEAAQAIHGGQIHDLAALREARRLWMEERYGKPATSQTTPSQEEQPPRGPE
jgi:hypothetical protein